MGSLARHYRLRSIDPKLSEQERQEALALYEKEHAAEQEKFAQLMLKLPKSNLSASA